MKIYIDGRCFSSEHWAGVARYVMNLIEFLSESKPSFKLFVVSHRTIRHKNRFPSRVFFQEFNKLKLIPGFFFIFLCSIFLDRNAIFLGTSHAVPIGWKGKNYLVIHDFCYRLFPDTMTFINRHLQRISIMVSLRATDKVIFVSKYTMQLFSELFSDIEHKYQKNLASNTVNRFFTSNNNFDVATIDSFSKLKPGNFLLYVGSLEPRKNIDLVIQTLSKERSLRSQSLVIAGSNSWKSDHIPHLIQSLDLVNRIHFITNAKDADLKWLYSNCSAFIFPSKYEGFGIPPFEAYACGAKVIATTKSEIKYYHHLPNVFMYDPDKDDLGAIINRVIKVDFISPDMSLLPAINLDFLDK